MEKHTDGDLDLVVGESDGNLNYYVNDGSEGSASFTEVTGSGNPFNGIDIGDRSAPTLVDLDNGSFGTWHAACLL